MPERKLQKIILTYITRIGNNGFQKCTILFPTMDSQVKKLSVIVTCQLPLTFVLIYTLSVHVKKFSYHTAQF